VNEKPSSTCLVERFAEEKAGALELLEEHSMRKLLCGIVAGAFLALVVNLTTAQTADSASPPPPYGHWGRGSIDPAEQAAHMAKHLSLTSEQQTQVQNILTTEQAQMKALNENQTITHQQWLAQTKALHQQTRTQINGLLTDAQKAQLSQHRGPEAMGDRQAAPPPDEQ
jgi:Spy/CpxP family protein refolding chaperone